MRNTLPEGKQYRDGDRSDLFRIKHKMAQGDEFQCGGMLYAVTDIYYRWHEKYGSMVVKAEYMGEIGQDSLPASIDPQVALGAGLGCFLAYILQEIKHVARLQEREAEGWAPTRKGQRALAPRIAKGLEIIRRELDGCELPEYIQAKLWEQLEVLEAERAVIH